MTVMSLIREIDDAPLTAFQRSMLLHIWRRGWARKSMRDLAEATGMSLGKASGVIKELCELGWIVEGDFKGYEGWRIATREDFESAPEDAPESVHHVNTDVHHMNTSVHHMNADVHHMNTSVHHVNTLYSSNAYSNAYSNASSNADGARAAPADLPAHMKGFNAMWQEQKPPDLIRRESVIQKLVRNPTDVENITSAARLSMDLGITDKQINDWFGPRAQYWYTVSHGRRDNLPPYAKNILSEVAGALQWSQLPPPPPPNGPPTVGIVGAVNEFGSY